MFQWTLQVRRALRGIALATLMLVPSCILPQPAEAQGYRNIISAHCTACKRPVSTASRKGDTCPHCGVVWGGEQFNEVSQPAPVNSRSRRSDTSGSSRRMSSTSTTRKSCTGCGRSIPASSKVGDDCPHCGVTWSFLRQEAGAGTEDMDTATSGPLIPLGPVRLASSVSSLKVRRPAVLGQLPAELRWLDGRAQRVLPRLPLVAQEAYYQALEDFASRDGASRARITTAVRALSNLPESKWSALAEDTTLAFGALATEPGGIARLRRDPVGTLRQVQNIAEFLATLE